MSNQTLATGSTITFTQQQLSNHNRSIETAERERIIELLEAEREKHIPWCGQVQPCPECLKTIGIENGIALIKGENKITVSADDAKQLAEAIYAPAQTSEALKRLFKG